MAYGPGDNPHAPKTKTVKVKAHTRKVQVKPTPVPGQTGSGSGPAPAPRGPRSIHNPIADDLAANGQGTTPPSRKSTTPTKRELDNAHATERTYGSQAESVANVAYQRTPAAQRREIIKADQAKAVSALGEAYRAYRRTGDPHAFQRALQNTSPRSIAERTELKIHGVRTSKHTREHNRLTGPEKAYGQSTGAAIPNVSVMPSKEKKHGSGLFGTIDNALSGKLTAGAVHAAEGAATKAAPFAYKAFEGPIGAVTNAAIKKATGVDVEKPAIKIATGAGRDVVDIPANAIPSLYVPAREAASGHPVKAAKLLAQPFIDTAKHPVKSFEEHPIGTVLLARGGEGALGHGIGKTLRTLPSDAARRAGSVERGTAEVANANIKAHEDRTYSKDSIVKAFQVMADKRRGGTKSPHMTNDEIKRRMDEQQSASEDVRRINRGEVVHEARTALNQRGPIAKVRGHRADAATTLAAQHIAHGPAELQTYLGRLEKQAETLKGDRLRRNKLAQKDIRRALRRANPKTEEQASKYRELNVRLQKELGDLEVISPKEMEQARLLGPAAARFGVRADEHGMYVEQPGKGRIDVSPDDVRTMLSKHGVTDEPAFLTHAPGQRGARNFFVRQDKAPEYHGAHRTGEGIAQGTADLDPEVMVEQVARTRGLIDAAHRFRAMIDEFAHRAPDNEVHRFKNWQDAEDAAREMHPSNMGPHAVEMTPVRINPLGGRRAQLEKTLEALHESDAHTHITEQIDHALSGADKASPGDWVLIPKAAADRMRQHLSVGQSGPGKFGQLYGGQFRKVVLSLSPKWLTGNVVEAALRTMIAHAGPRSVFTGYKALSEYEKKYGKEATTELTSRTTGGGHMSLAHRTDVRRGAQDFADSGRKVAAIAELMGKIRRAPGPKQVADLWDLYTHVVMKSLNGRIEHAFQTAQFGKALRESPLMSDHVIKLSKAAMDDAVEGLHDTNAQVRLGREVDRMYGRYAKFSPGKRRMIAGYTPFIAWYLNAVEFLTRVLPADHPVLTSVLASANQATEEWRKQHGLITSFVENLTGAKPDFLQGSIPGKDGTNLRISRFTPVGIFGQEGGVAGGVAGSILPQFEGMIHNAIGEDWKGDKLKKDGSTEGYNLLAAAVTFIENSVPLVSQGTTLAGAHLPNESEGTQHPDSLGARARKAYDPFMYAASNKGAPTVVKGTNHSAGAIPNLPDLPPLPKLPPLPPIR